jgi:hypothetical protein
VNETNSMRVALIGNMNNNHFAMMRYLIDRGIDAHLYLFKDEIDHFLPKNDTWSISFYSTRIHNLECGFPFNDLFTFRYNEFKQFVNFDIVIGCGLSPFYFAMARLKLDIFIPYGSDLYEIPFRTFTLRSPKLFLAEILNTLFLKRLQKNGIKNARKNVVLDFAKSYAAALNKLNVQSIKLHIPMVFREQDEFEVLPQAILDRLTLLKDNFVIVQHSRQYWHASLDGAHVEDMKYNNLLICAIQKLVEEGHHHVRCIFLEYGPDVNRSKALIHELNLNSYFIWLPKMPRKFLMKIIGEYAQLGVDQFGGGYFGGTGYEVLACAKPLMNAISISPDKYKEITGIEFPPIIDVSTVEEIAAAIAHYLAAPDELAILAQKSKNWFNENCGTGLIDTYIKMFEEIKAEKVKERGA